MPNTNILNQPLDFEVPIDDRDLVQECIRVALGRTIPMEFGNGTVAFSFSNRMELKAAEALIREVFAEEIKTKLGWYEWRLDI